MTIVWTLNRPAKTVNVGGSKKRHSYDLPEGVSYHTRQKRYVGRVYAGGKQVWLGSYKTANEAAMAVAFAKEYGTASIGVRTATVKAMSKIATGDKTFTLPGIIAYAPQVLPLLNPKPTAEEISERAYQLYVNRGYLDGFAEQDWAEAERQLIAEKVLK